MVVGTVADTLPEPQYCFQKGYSTEQAVLAVQTMIRKSLNLRRPVDLVFVDIIMAFDNVPHEALYDLLKRIRASESIQRSIPQLHEEPKGTIQGTTQHFTCKRGARQGSIEGLILFNLFQQKYLKRSSHMAITMVCPSQLRITRSNGS